MVASIICCSWGFLASFAQANETQQFADTRLEETHKERFDNYYKYLDAGEANVIALSGKRAKRAGTNLALTLAGGKSVTFVTRPTCVPNAKTAEEDCIFFHLMAAWPSRHFYLVHKGYWEGGELLLINDRDGQETILEGLPQFGPDKDRFLVLSAQGMDSSAAIRIYKFTDRGPVLEWDTDGFPIFEYAVPTMRQWTDTGISIEFRTYRSPKDYDVTGHASLVREDGTWRLLLGSAAP